MKKIIIDSNIILNVWRLETDPATGKKLFASSADILEMALRAEITGVLLTTTAMEVLHGVRVRAEITGKPAELAMKAAEKDIARSGLHLTIPDVSIMGMAYQLFRSLQTDPFDAILVAAAFTEKADSIISRDKKLKKKASKIIPILTPEDFLQ